MNSLKQLINHTEQRRELDKQRFEQLDQGQCQLCLASGCDKRSLVIDCFYAIGEVIDEAIDLHEVENGLNGRGYYLRICKNCRGEFLAHLRQWADEARKRRGSLMDDDGHPEDDIPEKNIPVRVDGRIVMMTPCEHKEYNREKP